MAGVSMWVALCVLSLLAAFGYPTQAEILIPDFLSENDFRSRFQHGVKTWWASAHQGLHFDMPSHVESSLQLYLTQKVTLRLLTQHQRINHALRQGSQISHAFLVDAHQLATLRARWPLPAIKKELENLIQEYNEKIRVLKRSVAMTSQTTTDSMISKLNLEDIIQGVILDLSTDPVAVMMAKWLASLPLKIHNWSEYMFTDKTFEEIFAEFGGLVGTSEPTPSSKPVINYPFHWAWMANTERLNEDAMKPVKFPLSDPGTDSDDNEMHTLFALLEAGLSEAEPLINHWKTDASQLLTTHLHALGVSDLLPNSKPAVALWNQTLNAALDFAVLKVKLV